MQARLIKVEQSVHKVNLLCNKEQWGLYDNAMMVK